MKRKFVFVVSFFITFAAFLLPSILLLPSRRNLLLLPLPLLLILLLLLPTTSLEAAAGQSGAPVAILSGAPTTGRKTTLVFKLVAIILTSTSTTFESERRFPKGSWSTDKRFYIVMQVIHS